MHSGRAIPICAALLAATACGDLSTAVETAPAPSVAPVLTTGGGHYELTSGGFVLPGRFSFTAVQRDGSGAADGELRHTLDLLGEIIDFHGRVTCMTTDPAEGRAWIGGVITQNNSVAEPYASEARFQVGRDIWFRVLDSGEGHGAVDRTTFVGFEGDAGFPTSVSYCAGMPWPDGNARTWPVTAGNIQVR